jgi:hypothetical protein
MRSLQLVLPLGIIVIALGVAGRSAGSSPFGSDIWKVRLDTSSSDHWLLLGTGHVRVAGHETSVFLLGHVKEDAPALGYDEMKVVGGAAGSSLWTYDGAGSDYAVGHGSGPGNASDEPVSSCSAPRLQDVDGDGSDDVVFVEQDFALGRSLRAVRIEP